MRTMKNKTAASADMHTAPDNPAGTSASSEEFRKELERQLIRSLVQTRKSQGITQTALAGLCNMKQPVIARIESCAHSPQLNSMLRLLEPLGYTLEIVPLRKDSDD